MTSSPNGTRQLTVHTSNVSQLTSDGIAVPIGSREKLNKIFERAKNPILTTNIEGCLIYQPMPNNEQQWPLHTDFITNYYQCESGGTQCPPSCPSNQRRLVANMPPPVSGAGGGNIGVDVGIDSGGGGNTAVSVGYDVGIDPITRPASNMIRASTINKNNYKCNPATNLCTCAKQQKSVLQFLNNSTACKAPCKETPEQCKAFDGAGFQFAQAKDNLMQDAFTCCGPCVNTQHFSHQTNNGMHAEDVPLNVSKEFVGPSENRSGIVQQSNIKAQQPGFMEACCQCDHDNDDYPYNAIDNLDYHCQCSLHQLQYGHATQPQTLQDPSILIRGSLKRSIMGGGSAAIINDSRTQQQSIFRSIQVNQSSLKQPTYNQPLQMSAVYNDEPKKLCLCKQPNAIVCVPESNIPASDGIYDVVGGNGGRIERICKCCTFDNTNNVGNKATGMDATDNPQCYCQVSTLPMDINWKTNVTNYVNSVTNWPRGYLKGGNNHECACTNARCKDTCTRYTKPKDTKDIACSCSNTNCKQKQVPESGIAGILPTLSEKPSTRASNTTPSAVESVYAGEEHNCSCKAGIKCPLHSANEDVPSHSHRGQELCEPDCPKKPTNATELCSAGVINTSDHSAAKDNQKNIFSAKDNCYCEAGIKCPLHSKQANEDVPSHSHREHELCECIKPDCPKKTANVSDLSSAGVIDTSDHNEAKDYQEDIHSEKDSCYCEAGIKCPLHSEKAHKDAPSHSHRGQELCECIKPDCLKKTTNVTSANVINTADNFSESANENKSIKEADVEVSFRPGDTIIPNEIESNVDEKLSGNVSKPVSQVTSTYASQIESNGKVSRQPSYVCPPGDANNTGISTINSNLIKNAKPPPNAKSIENAITILVNEDGQPMHVDGKGMQVVAYLSDGTPIVLPLGHDLQSVKSVAKSNQSEPSSKNDNISYYTEETIPEENYPGDETNVSNKVSNKSDAIDTLTSKISKNLESMIGSDKLISGTREPCCKCRTDKCFKPECNKKRQDFAYDRLPPDGIPITGVGGVNNPVDTQSAVISNTARSPNSRQTPAGTNPPNSPSHVTNITNTTTSAAEGSTGSSRKPLTVFDINDAAKCACSGPTHERCDKLRSQRREMPNKRINSRSSIVGTNSKPRDSYTQIERIQNASKCVCCPNKFQNSTKN